MFFFLMLRLPPRSTRSSTLLPYPTLFRSLALLASPPIAIARAAIAVLVLALVISLIVIPIAPRAISAIPVVSGIIARAFGAVMTALGALAPAPAMAAIARPLAPAEACFGVAALAVSAACAVRFPTCAPHRGCTAHDDLARKGDG